jgi:hypothetical protein
VLFSVDELLDCRKRRQGRKQITEYLVKWAGYGHEHNTWEPAVNIADPDLITQFEANVAARQKEVASGKQQRRCLRAVRRR